MKYLLHTLLIILTSLSLQAQVDTIDIYDLDFKHLANLQVSSTSKTFLSIREISATVFIISASEIKEKGYFTLDEALSDLPGFQFRDILGFNSYVFQRGIPNQNNLILVLIDGIQVNELNSGGFYGGGQYNLANVDRIEVVYGPGSVVYGTNAVSGIINIITKSATEKQMEINTLVGSFQTIYNNINYCYSNDKKDFGVRVSGMYKQSGKADLKGQDGDNNWTGLMENFENDYTTDIKIQYKNFTLGANYLQKQSSTATCMKSTGTIYKDYGTFWNIRFINTYLKFDRKISSHFTLSSTLYDRDATVLKNTVQYVLDTAQVGYFRPNNLAGIENIVNFSARKYFSCSGGLTLELEQLAKGFSVTYSDSSVFRPPTPGWPAIDKNYLASIFLEPRIILFNNFYLSGGLRFDESSIYEQVFTPRAGINYLYGKNKFRISYAEAFRAPKPWDYTDGIGNFSLLPETMKSLEAAITFSLTGNLQVDLIGYQNVLENALTKEFISESYKWINKGSISTDGLEFCLKYSSPKFKASFNYTFTESHNSAGEFIPEISKHTGNASATYLFNKHLKLNLRAHYTGARENPKVITATNTRTIDPFFVFHTTLSFINYKGFTFQFIMKNILDKEYYHTSNRLPDRYRQPQRTIMIAVSYSL